MYYERVLAEIKSSTTEALRKFHEGGGSYPFLRQPKTLSNLVNPAKFRQDINNQKTGRFSDKILKRLLVLSYAPNGMWMYIVSVYSMYHRSENDEIEENAFCRFLDCITAFTWAYTIISPGANSLRTLVYAGMVKVIRGEDIIFSDFRFSKERYRARIANYIFNNSRTITKSTITWQASQYDNQSLSSLENKFDIEHIYIRNRLDKEKGLSNLQSIGVLGNKVLLEKRLNIRISDYCLVDKIKYYKGFTVANGQEKNGSQIVELAEIGNSYSDFTETDTINYNSKIINSPVNSLRANQLLGE